MSQENEIIIVETANQVKNICVHEWIDDYIDISPELSQKICYCIKCEATKG